MKKTFLLIFLLAVPHLACAATLGLPEWEARIIKEVANQYSLSEEQTRLLFVIRKIENGKQGREFGVLVPQAMRYKNAPDKTKSFRLQAQWAAGTIKRRYKGDLLAFAKRWAPVGAKNDPYNLNSNWYKNASYYLDKIKKKGGGL